MQLTRTFILILLFGFLSSPLASLAYGETQLKIPPSAQVSEHLLTIQHDISWLVQQITQQKAQLENLKGQEADELREEIQDLQSRLQKARLNFIATVSEVELPAPENPNREKKRDLLQEVQLFIEPLFDALRRASEKPRRIEGYRTESFYLQDRLAKISKAISNLDLVIKGMTYPAFQKQFEESRETLVHNRDELQVQVDIIDRKLKQELFDHRTVLQVVKEEIGGFLSSEGKNLLIAFTVFAGALWTLLFLRRFIFRSEVILSKLRNFHRPFQAIYGVIASLIAIFIVLFTLHFLNDWFLVTVVTLFLLTLLWTSKTLIRVFLQETKLILNLGSVRQGERVIWMGIPWLVKSLGFNSVLVNEGLQGGRILLPASCLAKMFSRPTVQGEPWFPTQQGDFVQLDDGIYGRVEVQTPETVTVRVSSTLKHYATADFLSRHPQNYSQGFQITAEFSIRHSDPLPPLEVIRKGLLKNIKVKPELQNFQLNFNTSSLTLTRILLNVECPGTLASQRDSLRRDLQFAIGEAWCNLQSIMTHSA